MLVLRHQEVAGVERALRPRDEQDAPHRVPFVHVRDVASVGANELELRAERQTGGGKGESNQEPASIRGHWAERVVPTTCGQEDRGTRRSALVAAAREQPRGIP